MTNPRRNFQKLKTVEDYQYLDPPILIKKDLPIFCPYSVQYILRRSIVK